jgi:hypothetical protein
MLAGALTDLLGCLRYGDMVAVREAYTDRGFLQALDGGGVRMSPTRLSTWVVESPSSV